MQTRQAREGQCPLCGKKALFNPWPYTSYDGFHYKTIDGSEWVDHMKDGEISSNCLECEEK